MNPTPFSARWRRAGRWTLFAALLLVFVLLPFVLLEEQVNAVVEATLRGGVPWGWVAAAVIGFLLADIVLPVPSSFVLASGGFLLGAGPGALVAFVGLSCASFAGYAIGRWAGEPTARRIVGEHELQRLRTLAQHQGDTLLVAFRAAPVLAEASVLLAGTARMPLPRFALLVSLGNTVVAVLYAALGAWSAQQASFLAATAAAMAVPALVAWVARRWLARRQAPR